MRKRIDVLYYWYTILWISIVDCQLNLYDTDSNRNSILYYDCFYYNEQEDSLLWESIGRLQPHVPIHLIPYCIRPLIDNISQNELEENKHSSFRFDELDRMNITAEDLIQWSIPFDTVEDYQDYIHTKKSILAEKILYNCSDKWFGSDCQYKISPYRSFNDLVVSTYSRKSRRDLNEFFPFDSHDVTCYTLFECNRCLDWREICDGKIDCSVDGADEEHCLELEMNECTENEYRCHNGLCIPETFINDNPFYPDCLDRSDEQIHEGQVISNYVYENCYKHPGFRCEESYQHIRSTNFHCSDGETSHIFRSSCANGRNTIQFESLFLFERNPSLSVDCWLILSCVVGVRHVDQNDCIQFCKSLNCIYNLSVQCHNTNVVFFPEYPLLHDHIRFVYLINKTISRRYYEAAPLPDYICYDVRRCPFLKATLIINGTSCKRTEELRVNSIDEIDRYFRSCLNKYEKVNVTDTIRSKSLVECPGTSKYISKHRLLDGIVDCYEGIDEFNVTACSIDFKHRFQCTSQNKCLSPVVVYDGFQDCRNGEDEIYEKKQLLSFQEICDGFTKLKAQLIHGQNETDETNCEEWPCDNIYTRCDQTWSCLNGADESKCSHDNCPDDTLSCISPYNLSLVCLPIVYANDGNIDCLGASDERSYCRSIGEGNRQYKCWNDSKCISANDLCEEEMCSFDDVSGICSKRQSLRIVRRMEFDTIAGVVRSHATFFIPSIEMYSHRIDGVTDLVNRNAYVTKDFDPWICNRGIPILTRTKMTYRCFCPPSYFGDHCQFQSKRISLTLQLRKICAPNCFGLFQLLITLIDHEQIIHSHTHKLTTIRLKNVAKNSILISYIIKEHNFQIKLFEFA